ncbi:MAG: hypothetical protein Q8Q39_05420 [bacterium]|nr:hypothetical protein [bacterium]
MKLSGKDKLFLYALSWLAAVIGVLFAVLVPLSVRIQSFPSLYLTNAGQLRDLQQRVEAFDETKAEFERIMERASLVRGQFLPRIEAVTFIEWLEAKSAEFKLYRELRLLHEPTDTELATEQAAFEFQMTLVGSFERIMTFIAALEHAPYAIDVLKVSMDPTKQTQAYKSVGADDPFMPASGDIAASLTFRVHARR